MSHSNLTADVLGVSDNLFSASSLMHRAGVFDSGRRSLICSCSRDMEILDFDS